MSDGNLGRNVCNLSRRTEKGFGVSLVPHMDKLNEEKGFGVSLVPHMDKLNVILSASPTRGMWQPQFVAMSDSDGL